MKKIQLKKRKKAEQGPPSRITNETVAEHREQILAGGRRFKYPRQYARHKLVFNTIIIGVITIIILAVIGWWQLYVVQNTSDFFYRVSQVIPAPVASVDGPQVPYSDYLMRLKSSRHYLEQSERLNLNSEDGQRQVEFLKREALDGAIANTYAAKIAKERGIDISDEAVDKTLDDARTTVNGQISEDVYNDSTLSTLNYTVEEYRYVIKRLLLGQEVAYAIDNQAKLAKDQAENILASDKDISLTELQKQLKAEGHTVDVGVSGMVPKTNVDGGLSEAALSVDKGEFTNFIRSTTGDGYYLVQHVSSNSTQVNYAYLRIPLTTFEEKLVSLEKNNKIQEYIEVKNLDNATATRR